MRRIIFPLSIVALAGAALVGWTSSASGQQEGETYSFEVIKDVHGDGPTSGYVVEYSCVDDQQVEFASGTLHFDNIGPDGHESQEVFITRQGTCTIEETDANGADLVEYECEFFPVGDASTEGTPAGCLSDRSAHFTNFGDFASFLVRNTFDPDVGPGGDVKPGPYHQPTSTPPAVVTPGGVVAASPSFTG